MRYRIHIRGKAPLIMHNGAGIDPRNPISREKALITKKKGSNRTEADDLRLQQLECVGSLYLDRDGQPTMPPANFRSLIETGARKLKQGPQVREGLVVEETESFEFDRERYGESIEQWQDTCQFSAIVKVQRSSVVRVRAMFEDWACTFVVDCDDELIDKSQLAEWLDIAGRRIGLGDWRPECSGSFGRFSIISIQELD